MSPLKRYIVGGKITIFRDCLAKIVSRRKKLPSPRTVWDKSRFFIFLGQFTCLLRGLESKGARYHFAWSQGVDSLCFDQQSPSYCGLGIDSHLWIFNLQVCISLCNHLLFLPNFKERSTTIYAKSRTVL